MKYFLTILIVLFSTTCFADYYVCEFLIADENSRKAGALISSYNVKDLKEAKEEDNRDKKVVLINKYNEVVNDYKLDSEKTFDYNLVGTNLLVAKGE